MRKELVLDFWDRSNILTLSNKKYCSYMSEFIEQKLVEDAYDSDITTDSLIRKDKGAKAVVVAGQSGTIAGVEEASLFRRYFKIKAKKKDGDRAVKGDITLEIYGNERKILGCERTLLNIMQRMSGVATAAYNIKKIIRNKCFIAGTRKTLFGLIDKKAMSVGGALTHRLNLADFILIKDNHLQLLANSIECALALSNKTKKAKYIEIEVKNENEAVEAGSAIAELKSNKKFAVMFDNMEPMQIKASIKKMRGILKHKTKNKKIILFEASGGINDRNILEYSKTGVDAISLGSLTHSAKAFDMSLEIL